eukprot:CAMPEP_0176459344 /NCGR_PEP_ID=MMETSP0127-20121128/33215_1 /TAXON_ID=938130 /ORGANISM="Platyophrya macrostoma, Strain WH" /LENGTH=171 /DNA_ID=CAMNT_0017850251 /DNA_START=137 /DNA_END=652 /DNA_ORIENTATION=-
MASILGIVKMYDGIYIGNSQNAKNREELMGAGITHIVNCCAAKCGNYFPDRFKYLSLELKDTPEFDLSSYLFQAVEFIQEALDFEGKVFIHCNQGISRAPSILLAYYIWRYRVELEPCLEKLRVVYPKAEPNLGFMIHLGLFEKLVLKAIPKKRESMIIEDAPIEITVQNY